MWVFVVVVVVVFCCVFFALLLYCLFALLIDQLNNHDNGASECVSEFFSH